MSDRRDFFKTAAAAGLALAGSAARAARMAMTTTTSSAACSARASSTCRIPGTRTRRSPASTRPTRWSLNATHAGTRGTFGRRRPALLHLRDPALERAARRARASTPSATSATTASSSAASTPPQRPATRAASAAAASARISTSRTIRTSCWSTAACCSTWRASSTRNDDPLPPAFNITAEHLAETARHQGVRIKRGDTVLIRTGWGKLLQPRTRPLQGR